MLLHGYHFCHAGEQDTGAISRSTLDIYDVTGRLQRKITSLSPQTDIEGFAIRGVYLGRLTTRNNGVTNIKFVVQ